MKKSKLLSWLRKQQELVEKAQDYTREMTYREVIKKLEKKDA
jgi:hypothetical protein